MGETDCVVGEPLQENEEAREEDIVDAEVLPALEGNPIILTRDQHSLSRKNIDPDCLKVMHRLIQHGYRAFLVGGGVRDLLIDREPKDYDVATDARPEEVRSLFRNSRIIGRRFRLNQVYFGGTKIIEVATFRAGGDEEDDGGETAILQADNTYGTPESDARRRDLTINGLFYDPKTYTVIDYVGGVEDLKQGVVRIIGDPDRRFTEDPVRMIRAVRHASRVGFKIEPETWNAIQSKGELIHHCARSRIHEELLKDLRGGRSKEAFALLHESGLLKYFMPQLANSLSEPAGHDVIMSVLDRLDQRLRAGEDIPVSVLFLAPHLHLFPANTTADIGVIRNKVTDVFEDMGVTRREREGMEQILSLALRLFDSTGNPGKARNLATKQMFRAAMLLIEVTAANGAGEECVEFYRTIPVRPFSGRPSSGGGQPRRGYRRRR